MEEPCRWTGSFFSSSLLWLHIMLSILILSFSFIVSYFVKFKIQIPIRQNGHKYFFFFQEASSLSKIPIHWLWYQFLQPSLLHWIQEMESLFVKELLPGNDGCRNMQKTSTLKLVLVICLCLFVGFLGKCVKFPVSKESRKCGLILSSSHSQLVLIYFPTFLIYANFRKISECMQSTQNTIILHRTPLIFYVKRFICSS